ncbi:MAG: hypothetical protein H0Z29_07005 [Candidatus Marinimicrobia bacterium]|nr:hypothetical protein [Candidatus Neomarinimicrobiota bacterium]
MCIYGKIVSNWKFEQNRFILNVEKPFNTTANIILPCNSFENIEIIKGEKINKDNISIKSNRACINTGSGKYTFTISVEKLIQN